MLTIETSDQVRGLWSAIPTPWSAPGVLDIGILQRNVERLAAVPVDGIYTTDSDGEFYAIELDTFRRLAAVFTRALAPFRIGAQMGVTWCNTAGIIDRIKVCLDHGIRAVHVAFPFWMELSPSDVQRFWEDLATAVPEARWIHYNTSRGHRVLRGKDYKLLAAKYPQQFIGTKQGYMSPPDLVDVIDGAPDRSHFGADYVTVSGMMIGLRGTYSYWVNTLPKWTRRMTDLCLKREWEEAMAMQMRLLVWEIRHVKPLRDAGHLHGIIGKARGALSGFLEDSGLTQPPYYAVAPELIQTCKAAFETYWAGEE